LRIESVFPPLLLLLASLLCPGGAVADELPSFMSAIALDGYRLAMRANEQQTRTQQAADALSQAFAQADRVNEQKEKFNHIAIVEARDIGPSVSLDDKSTALPVAPVMTPEAGPVARSAASNGPAARPRSLTVRKSVVRLASLRTSLPARIESQPESQVNERAPLASSSMQPLLSNCGPMTPECLANRAWCGC
jgi:transcription initiation factor TFIID subunit TAF12